MQLVAIQYVVPRVLERGMWARLSRFRDEMEKATGDYEDRLINTVNDVYGHGRAVYG